MRGVVGWFSTRSRSEGSDPFVCQSDRGSLSDGLDSIRFDSLRYKMLILSYISYISYPAAILQLPLYCPPDSRANVVPSIPNTSFSRMGNCQ